MKGAYVVLWDATNRNTPAKWLTVFRVTMLVSYNTVVAAEFKGRHIRRDNTWGPTTGRHMNEAGVKGYDVLSDEEFHEALRSMLIESMAENVGEELTT